MTADLRREEIARTPEQALTDSIEGQNLYHGRHGTVPAGRTTALAILSGLRHDGFDLARSQDTAMARIAALSDALRTMLNHLNRAAQDVHYDEGHQPTGWQGCATELCREVRDDMEAARAVLSGETRT